MFEKINLLTADIQRANEPSFALRCDLPLTHLYDERFWEMLDPLVYPQETGFAFLDDRHWYYDDDVFVAYLGTLASIPFKAVCMGTVFPANEAQLYHRTRMLHEGIRKHQQDTIIVSLPVVACDEPQKTQWMEYLIYNRHFLDIVAVDGNQSEDRDLAKLGAILTKTLSVQAKDVWVMGAVKPDQTSKTFQFMENVAHQRTKWFCSG